jgi:4'-phosphopantetheinyl transferase EntD
MTLLSALVTDSVVAAEMYSDPPDLMPLPDEEPLISRAVLKRRNEFIAARQCARLALGELGFPPVPILREPRENPAGPTASSAA